MKVEIKKRIETIRQGEVPRGYKKTKVGIVPEEWEVKKASEIFNNYSNKKHDGNLPVLSSTQNLGIIPRDSLNINIKYDKENISSYKKVDAGDYVISLRSFQGGIEYSEYDGLVSPAYTVIKNLIPISATYYKEYFKTPEFISRLNSSIYGIRDGKQIGYEDFSDLLLHNPPYIEQEKIAKIIGVCDRVIQLKESLLSEKNILKKWLLENLLNPNSGIRLPGFKGKWEEKTLDSITKLTTGATPSTKNMEFWDGNIPWMNSGELNLKYINNVQGRITQLGYDSSSTKVIPKNCVLIGLAGQGKDTSSGL